MSSSWTPETEERMASVIRRAQRRGNVAFPISFVKGNVEATTGPPTLRRLLSAGGRGGEVRLKLYLVLTMLATDLSKDATIRAPYRAESWARVLGLDDPVGSGRRRIAKALVSLEESKLIVRAKPQSGEPSPLVLLNPDGSGTTHPGRASGGAGRYVGVPLNFWSRGWVVVLSGRGVGTYLMLQELTGGKSVPQALPSVRREQYGVSEDTWQRGVTELERHGLVVVDRRQVEDSEWYKRRSRNLYRLDDERLSKAPPS